MNANIYDYKSGDKLGLVEMTQKAWKSYMGAAQQPQGLIRADHVLTAAIRDVLGVRPDQTIFLHETYQNPMSASDILSDLDMSLGTASKSAVKLAYRLADDGGTIQAGDMRQLTSAPERHTTTSLTSALLMLGCKRN